VIEIIESNYDIGSEQGKRYAEQRKRNYKKYGRYTLTH